MLTLELSELLHHEVLIFDGAMGTELYRRHIFTNRSFDELCLSDPKLVLEIHRDYLAAGADVLTTNSFGANAPALRKFGYAELIAINQAAARLARQAIAEFTPHLKRRVLVAGSIGPLDNPGGGFDAAQHSAHKVFSMTERSKMLAEQATALLEGGADFIIFETLPDREAALAAQHAMALLPPGTAFILSHAFDDNINLATAIPNRFASNPAATGLPQPAAIGLNCGMGPAHMLDAVEIVRKIVSLPLVIQPNAGMPQEIDHRSLYLCSPEYLTTYAVRYIGLGVRAVGGCCGTTPEHIADLSRSVKPLGKRPVEICITAAPAATPVEKQPEMPLEQRSALGAKLARHAWVTTIEITPPRGYDMGKALEKARRCHDAGIDVLNIPDGPRAAPRLSALATAVRVQNDAHQDVVLHVCARDRNYIGLQGDLLGCAALGIHNLMFITGDPPKLGNYTFATGVFDTDSVGLVKLQHRLNQGVDLAEQRITPPTHAVIGVGADPNALDFDHEIQHLRDKVAAGANYVTTQPIFDPQAFFRFADAIADLQLPIIAGIWPLVSLRNALFMKNEVPGVVVPDAIIARMEKAATQAEQLATGIAIAREMLAAIRSRCSGVQVSATLGNIDAALQVLA